MQENISDKIKQTITNAEPDACVILYGSRARGDAHDSSDWDVLILLKRHNVSLKDEQFFRHLLYNIELETGAVISTNVYSNDYWNNKMSITPLFNNIRKEGVIL